MDALIEITPDGTEVWHIDRGWSTMVALFGDDFDYSSISTDKLHMIADGLRTTWAAIDAERNGCCETRGPGNGTENSLGDSDTARNRLSSPCSGGHATQAQAFMLSPNPPMDTD